MTSLEKKLRALANGRDLPWDQTKALLEKLGAEVIPPRGGGSHFKIVCKGYSTMMPICLRSWRWALRLRLRP